MARKRPQPTISETLRQYFIDSQITALEMAERSRIDQAALSRFRSGQRGLSIPALDTLAKELGLELVQTSKPKPPRPRPPLRDGSTTSKSKTGKNTTGKSKRPRKRRTT